MNTQHATFIHAYIHTYIHSRTEALINLGLENRAIAPTLMNSTSSRSHTVLTIYIEQRLPANPSLSRYMFMYVCMYVCMEYKTYVFASEPLTHCCFLLRKLLVVVVVVAVRLGQGYPPPWCARCGASC